MYRRTKIVSTLGPATDEPGVLEKLVLAGVNVVRMNFSHGSPEDHMGRANKLREICEKHNRYVAILGDLQGPKIRVARFAEGPVTLTVGDKFVLDAELERDAGNKNQVGIDYKELPKDVNPGDRLLLDDGRVILTVDSVDGSCVNTIVEVGGKLSNNKGINREGGGLTAPALTDKDRADIHTAVKIGVDYLAVSFPRTAEDMNLARQLVGEAGGKDISLVAKVERAESVSDDKILDDLIIASDAVMVARGDLGVEIGDAQLIAVQKHIIQRSRELNRTVITATQMMETMITSPLPTRAEVFDVAVQTVEAMVRVILGAEKHPQAETTPSTPEGGYDAIDQSVAIATMYIAHEMADVTAIAAMTESGATAMLMSRFGSRLPIFAFSRNPETLRKVALYRGVEPVLFDSNNIPHAETNARAVEYLLEHDIVKEGDMLLLTKGDYANVHGGTNLMKIMRVGNPIPKS